MGVNYLFAHLVSIDVGGGLWGLMVNYSSHLVSIDVGLMEGQQPIILHT